MKNLVVIISLVLTLAACSGETTKETKAEGNTETNSVNEEFPKELMTELEDMEIFEQKSVAKEKDISLIDTDDTDDTEGQFSEKEKITYLSNYSNIYTLLEFDTFIVRTLLNDYKTMENPTKTFEWVLYADSIFLSYIKQMEFDELDRKTKKFHEGINGILVESINNRRELVQAWLDYTQGKDTKLAIDDIKLNLSEENLYSVSISIGMAFAIFTSENIGTYDVSHYTSYGHNQIELANLSVKRMLLKYYESVSLSSEMTLKDLVDKFNEEEEFEGSDNSESHLEEGQTSSPGNNINSETKAHTNSLMSQIENSEVLYDYYNNFRDDYANAIETIDFTYIEEYFKQGSKISSDYEKFVLDHHNMDDYSYEFLSNELYYYEFIDENTVNAFTREEFNFYSATDGGYYYNRDKRYIIKQENGQWYIEDIQIEDTIKEKI